MLKALMIGIVALALVIIAFLVVRFNAASGAARVALTTVSLSCFQSATSNYFKEFDEWPKALQSLYANGNPQKVGFIGDDPNDAWGRPLVFEPFSEKRGFGRILSYGRDGRLGGTGPDADIEVRFGK